MNLAPLLTFAAALLAAAGLQVMLPERRATPPGRMSAGGRVVSLFAAAGRRMRPRGVRAPLDLESRIAAAGLGGAVLAELASPGYLRDISSSFLTAWLAGIALVMQLTAAAAIRRLGRVRG